MDQQAKNCIHQLCGGIQCRLEDLPRTMTVRNDGERERERERERENVDNGDD